MHATYLTKPHKCMKSIFGQIPKPLIPFQFGVGVPFSRTLIPPFTRCPGIDSVENLGCVEQRLRPLRDCLEVSDRLA